MSQSLKEGDGPGVSGAGSGQRSCRCLGSGATGKPSQVGTVVSRDRQADCIRHSGG
jgi:hypothetical protein